VHHKVLEKKPKKKGLMMAISVMMSVKWLFKVVLPEVEVHYLTSLLGQKAELEVQ
jgi:hypothetical protein